MGIKPFRSLAQGQIFSSNNALSANIQQKYQTIRFADLEQQQQNSSEIVYSSQQPINEQYLLKEVVRYHSAEQFDSLNEYIFFLKNNSSNMDITNLHVPYQIRIKSKGICEQMQEVQIYYPYYQYKMRPELQARQNRGQSFNQSQIWYLLMSVLNGMRQFERSKCVSCQFNMDSIRFNSIGCVKIDSVMSSPSRLQSSRDQRMYWSHKNLVNYYVQQTYRLALILIELCSFSPLQYILKEAKKRDRAVINGIALYNLQDSANQTAERQIQRALQIIRQRYSQLLHNLLNVMLCHPRDRPLPSQIYQVLVPYKNEIMQFKPFSFNNKMMATIKASLNASNISRQSFSQPNINYGKNSINVQNSLQIGNSHNQNVFNSMTSPIRSPPYLNESAELNQSDFDQMSKSRQVETNGYTRIRGQNQYYTNNNFEAQRRYKDGNQQRERNNRQISIYDYRADRRNLSVNPAFSSIPVDNRSNSINANKAGRPMKNVYPVYEQRNNKNDKSNSNRYISNNPAKMMRPPNPFNTSLDMNTYESNMRPVSIYTAHPNQNNGGRSTRNNQAVQYRDALHQSPYPMQYVSR